MNLKLSVVLPDTAFTRTELAALARRYESDAAVALVCAPQWEDQEPDRAARQREKAHFYRTISEAYLKVANRKARANDG